jgi:hypothetical protein
MISINPINKRRKLYKTVRPFSYGTTVITDYRQEEINIKHIYKQKTDKNVTLSTKPLILKLKCLWESLYKILGTNVSNHWNLIKQAQKEEISKY